MKIQVHCPFAIFLKLSIELIRNQSETNVRDQNFDTRRVVLTSMFAMVIRAILIVYYYVKGMLKVFYTV